jgi:hypothetical protein
VFSPLDYGQSSASAIKESSVTNFPANEEKIAQIKHSSVAANVFWCSSRKVDELVDAKRSDKKTIPIPKPKSKQESFQTVQEYRSINRVVQRSLWSRQLLPANDLFFSLSHRNTKILYVTSLSALFFGCLLCTVTV